MILKKIIVGHYCSYENRIEIGDFNNINFIIGKNGSGKSNLQKCFKIFDDVFNGNYNIDDRDIYNFDLTKNTTLGFIINMTSDESNEILEKYDGDNTITIKNIYYELQYKNNKIVSELFTIDTMDDKRTILYKFDITQSTILMVEPDEFLNYLSTPLLTLNDVTIDTQNIFSYLEKWPVIQNKLKSFFKVQIIKSNRLIQPTSQLEENTIVPIDGKNYSTYLNTLSSSHGDKEDKYDNTINNLSSKRIEKVKAVNSGHSAKLMIKMNNLPNQLEFDQISSGEKEHLLFANIGEIQTNILCIEEPELHLHASAQKSLLDELRKYSSDTNTQLFIESHSSIFVGCKNNESTHLFIKDNSATTTIMIDKSNIDVINQELGINYSDIFDHDYFLFVEGKSEKHAFRIMKKNMGYDNNINCWNVGGYTNMKQLEFLLIHLHKTSRKKLIIVDNHKECIEIKQKLIDKKLINNNEFIILDKSFEDTFSKSTILDTVKYLYGDQAFKLINEKYGTEDHVTKLLEYYIDDGKYGGKYNKIEFASALTNTIKPENIDSNKFTNAINNFLSN